MTKIERKWVAVELSLQGERKPPAELEMVVRSEIGEGVEIFVPSVSFTRRESEVVLCLMEGYFFVEAALPPSTYFSLERSPYVERVLTRDEPEGRFICYVGDETITELKGGLAELVSRDIKVGDYVRVVEGVYSDLSGRILSVDQEKEKASVHIVDLRSMEVIVELPFQFFEPEERGDED